MVLMIDSLRALAAGALYWGTGSERTLAHRPKGSVWRVLPSGRTFLLNVPEVYDPSQAHPLILSFHGAGGNSSKQEHITELSAPGLTVAGLPILVAYAQGVNNTDWGMNHIWQGAPYGNLTVDDVQYVKDIILDVSADYTVDPARQYACGKSNGGGFTALLACRPDTSKLFAAFAPVSPALYPATGAFGDCHPARPVPILHSHGVVDADTFFHGHQPFPKACGFGPEPDVKDWRRDWAERNGCQRSENGTLEPYTIGHPHPDTTEETWECGATVKALTMGHLGHAWPSTQGLDLAGFPNQTATFNFTTDHLLPFFTEHVLPSEYLE